jgi:hypothetical protein
MVRNRANEDEILPLEDEKSFSGFSVGAARELADENDSSSISKLDG